MSLTCRSRPLHWDKIAKLWVCDSCGASLSYERWNCGGTLDCHGDRLPRDTGRLLPRPTYLRERP